MKVQMVTMVTLLVAAVGGVYSAPEVPPGSEHTAVTLRNSTGELAAVPLNNTVVSSLGSSNSTSKYIIYFTPTVYVFTVLPLLLATVLYMIQRSYM